ncbi:MAG: hypothetical protein K2G45_12355 [Lachnospiraceae bacterium]|nr:hypothetical protein [Lachnospiraceae bacterium]
MSGKKIITIILCVLIIARIAYVNLNARQRTVTTAEQGKTIEYNGVKYSIANAVLWEYGDFFDANGDCAKFEEETLRHDGTKILVVDIRIEKANDREDAMIEQSIPITYYHVVNWYNPYLTAFINREKTSLKSGDTISIPYEIYESSLNNKQRKNMDTMEFRLVFGSYPERKELLINDYKRKEYAGE